MQKSCKAKGTYENSSRRGRRISCYLSPSYCWLISSIVGVKMSSSNGHPPISQPFSTPRVAQEARDASTKLLPHAPQYTLRGSLPNTPLAVSLISAILGGLSLTALAYSALPLFQILGAGSWTWARSRLGVYVFAWGLFHLCEFWTTAGWNPQKLSVDGKSRFAAIITDKDSIPPQQYQPISLCACFWLDRVLYIVLLLPGQV